MAPSLAVGVSLTGRWVTLCMGFCDKFLAMHCVGQRVRADLVTCDVDGAVLSSN